MTRRFQLAGPYVLLEPAETSEFRASRTALDASSSYSLPTAATWGSPISAKFILMLRKRQRWSIFSTGAAICVPKRRGFIWRSRMALGSAVPARPPPDRSIPVSASLAPPAWRMTGDSYCVSRSSGFRSAGFGASCVFGYRFIFDAFAQLRAGAFGSLIVGLEHGHITGFLKQFPNQHEVQLVGIVETMPAHSSLRGEVSSRFQPVLYPDGHHGRGTASAGPLVYTSIGSTAKSSKRQPSSG